jgi:P2-related tail formation protein
MMKESELIRSFQSWEQQLNNYRYKVSVLTNGFYIHNSKGTIVAECQTVDGLRGFAQAVEYFTPDAGVEEK